MDVLVIGGTRFVGRHIAGAFSQSGHRVTLFNRGTDQSVHAELEQVHGDRANDLSRLGGRTWDAVVDACGYTPDVVEISARYFKDRAKRYVFVSTISVYDEKATAGPDEQSPVLGFPAGEDPGQFSVERYGALKVLCEQTVQRVFGANASILRPGLVAGPYDHTDRFTYWPVRFDDGGDVLGPLAHSRVQYIDARDLAAFAVHAVETRTDGVFNCVTSARSLNFGDLYEACMHAASAEDVAVIAVPDEFLGAHDVKPWSELPLWIPAEIPDASIAYADASRAVAAGLRTRPIQETARDTLAWARTAQKRLGSLQAGLEPAREAELVTQARAAGHAAVK